jgi:bifunctional DNase/RNase/predicted RNase H-like HicB family nuclease
MQYKHEVIVKQLEGGVFLAYCPSLPGCEARGTTPADAVAKIKGLITAYVKNHSRQGSLKCNVSDCEVEPTFHFTRIESRRVVFEKSICEVHAQTFFAEFRATVTVGSGAQRVAPGLACVDLEMIVYHDGLENDPACVYLHEVGGGRRFGIMVDGWAWWALMAQIKQQAAPYPLTHTAWAETITSLAGELQDVVVDRREGEDLCSAKVRLAREGRFISVDVRPADGFTLAVRCGAPIFIVEEALNRFGEIPAGTS